jgi:transglutaminase-like putative cysteine protease
MSYEAAGRVPVPYLIGTIPDGAAGVRATLDIMVDITLRYRCHPLVRVTAQRLATQCANRAALCQVETLHAFVRDQIKYLPDCRDVETIQTPDYTLNEGSGDCDDQSVLMASLLESIGFETRFCAVSIRGGPTSHVSSQVKLGRGWINLETILRQLPHDWSTYSRGDPMPIGWFPPDAKCDRLARVP